MKKIIATLALALLAQAGCAAENPENATADLTPEHAAMLAMAQQTPSRGTVEPAILERAEGWEWDHEVRVYLPPTYQLTDKAYPTLWVTDNALETAQAALAGDSLGMRTEMIVVAVGAPADVTMAEFGRRRSYDFIPEASLMGPNFAAVEAQGRARFGGAEGFRDFLVNQLRPKLAKQYRMDPEGHTYAGHSGGGQFGLYVLLNHPESFAKYIISSPADYQPWLDMEEKWHANNKDLPAEVFISAGEAEMYHPMWSTAEIVSTVVLMTERLTSRNYPSLTLHSRIFPNDDHFTVWPTAYMWGIEELWVKGK